MPEHLRCLLGVPANPFLETNITSHSVVLKETVMTNKNKKKSAILPLTPYLSIQMTSVTQNHVFSVTNIHSKPG